MGRRIHKSLSYEQNRVVSVTHQLKWLSKILYLCDSMWGKTRRNEVCYTYGCGIEFSDLTKEEYADIRNKLNHKQSLKKEISSWGVTFSDIKYHTGYFDNEDKPINIAVSYKFGLPESCKVEIISTWEEMDKDKVKIKDGKVLQQFTETKVSCGEPAMMKAVFDKDKGGVNADA